MGTAIVFFSSLGGTVLFFIVKVIEDRRGSRFFFAKRAHFDAYLERKLEGIRRIALYFNFMTFKLLLAFLAGEFKELVVFLSRRARATQVGEMVSGKRTLNVQNLPTNSEFLKGIPSLKSEKRESSNPL